MQMYCVLKIRLVWIMTQVMSPQQRYSISSMSHTYWYTLLFSCVCLPDISAELPQFYQQLRLAPEFSLCYTDKHKRFMR